MIGNRYTRLTVIANAPMKNGRGRVLCRCMCGTEKEVTARDLRRGRIKSCGCLKREVTALWRSNPLDNVDEDIVR
jgi:hypothetical protein